MSRGDFGWGDFVQGDFVRGDFVRGDFVRGDFVRGDFVRGDFVLEPHTVYGELYSTVHPLALHGKHKCIDM